MMASRRLRVLSSRSPGGCGGHALGDGLGRDGKEGGGGGRAAVVCALLRCRTRRPFQTVGSLLFLNMCLLS